MVIEGICHQTLRSEESEDHSQLARHADQVTGFLQARPSLMMA